VWKSIFQLKNLHCRSAIPPGARFDPFGPPDLDPLRPHRRRPDDDHLPPPGYDDMFQ